MVDKRTFIRLFSVLKLYADVKERKLESIFQLGPVTGQRRFGAMEL